MQKYHIIFDASILTNEFYNNGARSGIFFVTKNIFNQLLQRDDINLFLWCDLKKLSDLKKFLQKYQLENLEIINEIEFGALDKLQLCTRNLKNNNLKQNHKIIRNFIILFDNIISLLIKIKNRYNNHSKLIEKLKPINFYFSPCTHVPMVIKKQKHILSSVYLHDTIPFLFPQYFPKIFSGKYWICNLVNNLSKEELYFANSDCTKNDFLRLFPEKIDKNKIKTVLLACDERFKPSTSEETKNVFQKYNIPIDKKYIFSLCTQEPRKNLIRIVKTFIEFIKKHNIDNLIFVMGGGHWNEFIQTLNKELQNLNEYKDKIINIGYVDDEDLPVLYSGAQWFVYTSQYEGFGLPVLEAMSCGCPVITSNNSSLPEVVGDAGITIDWDNDEQHIEAYEQYYFNSELRKQNSEKGLKRSKLFSWKKCTDEIIKELIK